MLVKRTQLVSTVTLALFVALTVAASGCRPEPVRWSELGSELEQQGYRVIRFTNRQVQEQLEEVLAAVLEGCGE